MRGGTSGSGGPAALTFLAAQPFCPSQSGGCSCRGATLKKAVKMLSVRVAAAVARALPRRAGLVSAGSWREGCGPAGGRWCADSRALSARRVRGWRAPPSCTVGCSGWAGRRRKGLVARHPCGTVQGGAGEVLTSLLSRDGASKRVPELSPVLPERGLG